MKRIFALVILLTIALPTSANAAAQCVTKVCIKVFTDPKTGAVVIQAVQNAPGSSATPRPKPTRTYKPRPYTPRPKPVVPRTPKPYVARKYVPKAVKSIKPKIVTAISLSDQLTQLIPMREIYYQPNPGALTQVPVNFWTTTNPVFNTSVMILGIPVSVFLKPTFEWDFGDGSKLTTSNRGGPYPNNSVAHTYTSAGNYSASLTVSWAGTWMADLLSYPVLGNAIVQHMVANIAVHDGPTKYLK